MIKPKISIVTVCYNSRTTIEETIESVVNQDYDNIEYVIIDGGSTDGTMDIVNRYLDKIDVVVSESDHGISDAFNKGIERATGDIIGLINSDDLLVEGALRALVSSYSPDVDVYRGNMIIEDCESGKRYGARPAMKFSMGKRISNVCHPSTFITKNAYQKWGNYRVDLKYKMDVDLLCRFYRLGARFKSVESELAIFRLGGRTSDNWRKKKDEYKEVLRTNHCPRMIYIYRIVEYELYCTLKQFVGNILGNSCLMKWKYGNY